MCARIAFLLGFGSFWKHLGANRVRMKICKFVQCFGAEEETMECRRNFRTLCLTPAFAWRHFSWPRRGCNRLRSLEFAGGALRVTALRPFRSRSEVVDVKREPLASPLA